MPESVGASRLRPRGRAIAFYLPQFHPIPENDEWWGAGFTEWTNVVAAQPLFRGHLQPRLPADLGFYDLRVPEVRQAQADLAASALVEAFCYWHYWFAGRTLLERPFREVLASGRPDFPFMLAWANQSWTGIWHGSPDRVLVQQSYPGLDDHRAHLDALLPAFHDPRYLRVDGRPALYLYRPHDIPGLAQVLDMWRSRAQASGLAGLYVIGEQHDNRVELLRGPLDAVVPVRLPRAGRTRQRVRRLVRAKAPVRYSYAKVMTDLVPPEVAGHDVHPCVVPDWDNSPRSGGGARVLTGSTPELFAQQVAGALSLIERKSPDRRLLFIKSWNEWAEGNYLEPDRRHGHAYLDALREALEGVDASLERPARGRHV